MNTLKNLGEVLGKVFAVIIMLLTFISFSNSAIPEDAIDRLNKQIEFNEAHKQSAIGVEGIKPDGTKMTEEEIRQQKEWEKQIKDIDFFTPKMIEIVKKISIPTPIVFMATVVATGVLILLGFGIFKTIARISSSLLLGILLEIGFVFNFIRYVDIGKIQDVCKAEISIGIVLFVIYLIFKVIAVKLATSKKRKELKRMEDKIRDRLQATRNVEQEILSDIGRTNEPIFIITSKEEKLTPDLRNGQNNVEIIDDERREIQELNKIAYNDELTGVFNRAAFNKDKDKYEKDKTDCVIAMFDVNNLKTTNDRLGHKYGDTLIKIVANTISDTFKGVGKCYRLGGDEFVVMAKNRKIDAKVAKCIDEVKAILAERNYAAVFPELITVSCGYAVYNSLKHNTLDDVLDEADKLMYEDKKAQKELLKKQTSNEIAPEKTTSEETVSEETKPEEIKKEKHKHKKDKKAEIQEEVKTEENNQEIIEASKKSEIIPEKKPEDKVDTIETEVIKEKVENNNQKEDIEESKEDLDKKETQTKEEEPDTTVKKVDKAVEEEKPAEVVEEIKPEVSNDINKKSSLIENKKEEPIKQKEDLSNIEIIGQTQEYVYETYIEKIDGTRQKIEHPDTTITADYESIRKYLDKKEEQKNEDAEEPKKTEDLPYANYDPEKESPFARSNAEIIETDAEIIERNEVNNIDIEKTETREDDDV